MRKRRNQPQIEVELKIEYLNERGYGVSYYEEKQVHILNALPGEKIKVQIFKRRKGIYLAHTIEVLEKADYRLPHKEDHYLSCSPWQIIPIEKENNFKKFLIKGFFKDSADIVIEDFDIVSGELEYNYRNKVEFSFYGHDDEHVTLAFHTRESGFHKIPADFCVLMPDLVNKTAEIIIKFINENNIRAKQLKGLLIRYSYFENKVFAALYVKDKTLKADFNEILNNDFIKGFAVIHSDFRSPAFVETDILYEDGDLNLTEKILNQKLKYSYNGFFQVNPPVFEKAMDDIKEYVSRIPNVSEKIAADIYAGVGSIGLGIAQYVSKIICVEITPNAKEYALDNAENNNINNLEFYEGLAETTGLEYVGSDILILDPPRVGLHQKVIDRILEIRPEYIVYLSCNPKTQAENISQIKKIYNIEFLKAYNFYPHTPHVENLCILKLKNDIL